jgi:hypothetical protein
MVLHDVQVLLVQLMQGWEGLVVQSDRKMKIWAQDHNTYKDREA